MRRLVLVATCVLIAFVAGSLVLAAALFVEVAMAPERTSMAIANVAALLLANLHAGMAGRMIGASLAAVWSALVAVCFAPVCLVAVVGEVVRVRSLMWSAAGTGALAAAMPSLVRATIEGGLHAGVGTEEGRLTLVFFLTGVATGFVYWLLAGRGNHRQ